MPLASIALGSNLGDRHANLRAARALLPATTASSIYETDPVDCPPGSLPFLNCVLQLDWPETATELHSLTKSIEAMLGRPDQHDRNSPRLIDLDLLAFGNESISTSTLQIPHPRMHLRRFVLQPLAEISPRLILPGFRLTVASLLAELNSPEPPLRLHHHQWT